jgi:hypothetical protein
MDLAVKARNLEVFLNNFASHVQYIRRFGDSTCSIQKTHLYCLHPNIGLMHGFCNSLPPSLSAATSCSTPIHSTLQSGVFEILIQLCLCPA